MIFHRLRTRRVPVLLIVLSTALAAGATHLHHRRQAENMAVIQRLNAELEQYRAEQRVFLEEIAP